MMPKPAGGFVKGDLARIVRAPKARKWGKFAFCRDHSVTGENDRGGKCKATDVPERRSGSGN
jgi:hypothetical protein